MAVDQKDQKQQKQQEGQGGAGGTAVKAAAAAAATSVAAIAARKALSNRKSSNGQGGSSSRGDSESVIGSVLSGGWDAARDALIPAAEDAAGAAGEYLARSGPEVFRERIVPRFVDSFNAARESSS